MAHDPVDKHRQSADEALASGDPHAIKRLYVDLGDDLWEAHQHDPESAPLFSYVGTHRVVAAALASVNGLLLDAGCGPNPALSIELAQVPGRTVVALDIGLGTVRSARALGAARGVQLLAVVGDVERLPFRDEVFDGVACDDTIEHLPDDARGASELARVARPGALVVVATPNRHSLKVLAKKMHDRVRGHRHPASHYFVSNSHIREYTWGEARRLLDPVLAYVDRHCVPFEARSGKGRVVNRLLRLPGLWRVAPMIVVRTRREPKVGPNPR